MAAVGEMMEHGTGGFTRSFYESVAISTPAWCYPTPLGVHAAAQAAVTQCLLSNYEGKRRGCRQTGCSADFLCKLSR